MKISRKTTHHMLPKAMFAVCTAGILAGSASAASTMPSAAKHAREQRREARYEQRLEQAVTNGKLTSAQEQAVLAEHNLLKAQLQAATPGTRKQVNQEVQNEAKSWAQQHGINIRWLLPRWHHHKAKT